MGQFRGRSGFCRTPDAIFTVSWRLRADWVSGGRGGRLQALMVPRLELGQRDIVAGRMKAPLVPPDHHAAVASSTWCRPPGYLGADELGLVGAVHRLGEGVVIASPKGAASAKMAA